jgi:hypothetical protein
LNEEQQRLADQKAGKAAWHHWGPYLSERQWGTVREDYSPNGTAWESFDHEMSRSRAYRWGEDGIGGISDAKQHLCFALALWNEKDPILKERLFGLTGNQGNHGEDVKELYYYLDSTPTHSYMKMLYKYPQAEYPYAKLLEENNKRNKLDPEYELMDTGVFKDNRYFDVFIEYAKISPEDILIKITAVNRGPETARLQLIPQLWFRNTWSWKADSPRPLMTLGKDRCIHAEQEEIGKWSLDYEGEPEAIFCDNDTNPKIWGKTGEGFFKDAFHDYMVKGLKDCISPSSRGTKAGLRFRLELAAGASQEIHLRLAQGAKPGMLDFQRNFETRRSEADRFYADLQRKMTDDDKKLVQRQALSGMLWSKQYYSYDVRNWLAGDPAQPPPPPGRSEGRNHDWTHLHNEDVISMPDKWEYPWYASWDLAFHCVTLALVDPEFAKHQLILLTKEWYQHPNGQLPAYEWALGDVNPPVHALAAWKIFQIDAKANGCPDHNFLQRIFNKLSLNFTWWVNRKDAEGNNIFEGGFLGLDNIGVFDRGAPLPEGGFLEQADGTAWMAMYCLNMMRIALELALVMPAYEDMATKFFEHFLYIAEAMTKIGGVNGLWNEADGFFYDVLHSGNGEVIPLKIHSVVGLVPLFAVECIEPSILEKLPTFKRRLEWFLKNRPDLANLVSRWGESGNDECRLLSLLRGQRMKLLLERMLNESEFLSDFGIRALSKYHQSHPYEFSGGGRTLSINYEPGESESELFGGNSNWRGPIWMPMNYLLLRSLENFHIYYGDDFKIECPVGSGKMLTLQAAADELKRRICSIFLKNAQGKRPVFGQYPLLRDDPEFSDHLLFFEYFHGDTGRGAGASHQTGWSGLVALLLND